jgi:hypothetical protein
MKRNSEILDVAVEVQEVPGAVRDLPVGVIFVFDAVSDVEKAQCMKRGKFVQHPEL